jgi:hypothetical protein
MDLHQINLVLTFVATSLGILVAFISVAQTVLQLRRRRRLGNRAAASPISPPQTKPRPSDLPIIGKESSSEHLRLAVRDELRAERRASFWPTFWLNLGTNFVVGVIFYALGIATTLYFGIGR